MQAEDTIRKAARDLVQAVDTDASSAALDALLKDEDAFVDALVAALTRRENVTTDWRDTLKAGHAIDCDLDDDCVCV